MNILIIALLIFGLALLGVPIAWALGFVGLIGIYLSPVPLQVVAHMTFSSAQTYSLVAIPLFMLMGALIERAGLGRILMDFASALVGWMRGGLAQVNVVGSLFFGGLNGSAAADVASIGSIVIPEMKRRGYPAGFAAAITSSSAELSIIIPPSIVLIVYGVLANVSIGQLFLAGFLPGLVLCISYMTLCWFFAWKYDWPVHEKFNPRRVVSTGIAAAPAMVIPIIIMGGILGGVFTATESAAVAVATTVVLVSTVYRGLSWRDVTGVLVLTAKRTGMVMVIVAASGTLAWYLAQQQIPQQLATAMLSISDNPLIILFMLSGFLVFLGMILSGVPAMIIVVPVVLPILTELGIDPLHFGIIFALAICVGSQTPPVAATMLLTCVIAKVRIGEMFKINKWYILVNILVMCMVILMPSIALWMPQYAYSE